jgi:hypothetical protein
VLGDAAVPVTARISKKLHDHFGDDVAGELVDWFNQVDATTRSDLREFNDLNFARFDAKLEQRLAALRSEMDRRFADCGLRCTAQLPRRARAFCAG